jgi:hypothetical protein
MLVIRDKQGRTELRQETECVRQKQRERKWREEGRKKICKMESGRQVERKNKKKNK